MSDPREKQSTALGDQFVVETPSSGLPWRLMIFAIFLFFFSVFVYVGIKFGYTSYLDSRVESLKTETATLAKQISKNDQDQFINFYSQISNIKRIFSSHRFTSNTFLFLEKNTSDSVYYTAASYTGDNEMSIKGIALSNEALVQQLSVFDSAQELKEAVLTQMNFTDNGKMSFEINLVFNDEFFDNPI